MSWILRGRDLLFGAYNHIPHIFIVGSLLLGAVTGILPVLILGLVTAFLGVIVLGFQTVLKGLFGNDLTALRLLSSALPCNAGKPDSYEFLISSWGTITTFVLTYIFLNALAVYNYTSVAGADLTLVANRESYMVSTMLGVLLTAILLLGIRMKIGCESYVMGICSIILGVGVAFGMWNLVTPTTNGAKDLRMGDVFQIRNNMITTASQGNITPIVCLPPSI